MKPFVLSFVALLVFLTLAPREAAAWGDDGHRVICAMAWDEVTPATRAKIRHLLDIKSVKQFADLCLWADQYRDTHPETGRWHGVIVAAGATSVDPVRDCPEPRSCNLVQIGRWLAVLESPAPAEERAMALKFVIHFVGDLHQPLHVLPAGHGIGFQLHGHFLGQATDMHDLWDTDLLASLHLSWPALAARLEAGVSKRQRAEWTKSQPIDWANESLAVAMAPATAFNDASQGFDWGEDYIAENLPIAEDRLARAGVRLGHLLNQALAGTR